MFSTRAIQQRCTLEILPKLDTFRLPIECLDERWPDKIINNLPQWLYLIRPEFAEWPELPSVEADDDLLLRLRERLDKNIRWVLNETPIARSSRVGKTRRYRIDVVSKKVFCSGIQTEASDNILGFPEITPLNNWRRILADLEIDGVTLSQPGFDQGYRADSVSLEVVKLNSTFVK